MKEHTTVRLKPGLMSAVRRQQLAERRESQTEMIAVLIEDGLRARDLYSFNAAMRHVHVYSGRDLFHDWCKANNVPAYNTIEEWHNYATQFETDGDAADLRNTQADAL